VRPEDFAKFDLMLAMDRDNLRHLEKERARFGESTRIALLREFDPDSAGDLDVPDPYSGGPSEFDLVFDLVHRSCTALLGELLDPQIPCELPPAFLREDDP
jgi:protein-tyrosine phosphatase